MELKFCRSHESDAIQALQANRSGPSCPLLPPLAPPSMSSRRSCRSSAVAEFAGRQATSTRPVKRKLIVAILALVALLIAGFFAVSWYQEREAARQRELANRLPEIAYETLLNDPGLVLFSLDPDQQHAVRGTKQFHDYLILGETVVGSASSRQALAATLKRSLAAWGGGYTMCFNPRHGLRATHGGKSFEFLICFECGRLYVYPSTGDPFSYELAGEAGPFHDLLVAANIPTTPHE